MRIALAKRDLRDATWPGLAGTLAAEGSFETFFGLITALRGGSAVPVALAVASASRGIPLLGTPRACFGELSPFSPKMNKVADTIVVAADAMKRALGMLSSPLGTEAFPCCEL